MPLWFSPITVPNQPVTMTMIVANPVSMIQKPRSAPFSQDETPTMRKRSPIEPTMGQ